MLTDRRRAKARIALASATLVLAPMLGGCFTKQQTHGYVFTQTQIDQVPVGASREQVDFVLGSPSSTGNFEGLTGEVFYYISQTTQQTAFFSPEIVDQRVLAVYFDETNTVSRVADYGLQDGRVFDFVSETTPTSGEEVTFLKQILGATLANPLADN